VRAFGPPPPAAPAERGHPLWRRAYEPNARVPRRDPRTGELVPIETNAIGARGRSVKALAKDKDAYRIVFLGGGPLEGAGLAEEQTIPGRVESLLDQRRKNDDDLRVESVNLAGEGLGLSEALALLVHRASPLKPDMVVLMPGLEDMVKVARPGFDVTRSAEAFPAPERPSFGDWLETRSRLAFVVRRAVSGGPKPPVDPRVQRQQVPFTPADLRATVPFLQRHLHLLSLAAKDARVPLAFVTIPTLLRDGAIEREENDRFRWGYVDDSWNLDPASIQAGVRAWNEEMHAASAREGALIIDLEPAVTRDLAHFDDEVTLTSEGCASAAGEITRALFGSGPARRAP
jgi:hypothetical protein